MRQRLLDVATDLIIRFVKPSVVSESGNLFTIEHHRRSKQKDRDSLIIGDEARQFLGRDKAETGLSNTAVTEFFEDVRAFYSKSLKYIFDKMPLDSDVLEHAEVLNCRNRTKHKFTSVKYFLDNFKCFAKENRGTAELEFARYQVHNLEGINMDGRIDAVWVSIGTIADSSGKLLFSTISKIMLGIASIPHSNAAAERIFSMVRKNKTEQRASMSRNLLTDVIRVKVHMLATQKECHSLPLDKAALAAAKSQDQ